jgi:hypothetical protein
MAGEIRWSVPLGVGLVGGLALLAGAWWNHATSLAAGRPRTISVHAPGAMNLAVYCGGEETHFADGEWIEFAPDAPPGGPQICELEGPLNPVMPVRGRFTLDGSSRYRCERHAMEYVCTGD